jgi:hypothetical protein
VCAEDYYFQSSTNSCEQCSAGSIWKEPFVIAVIVIVAFTLCTVIYAMLTIRSGDDKVHKIRSMDDALLWLYCRCYSSSETKASELMSDLKQQNLHTRITAARKLITWRLKILLVYAQTVASFPYVLQFDDMPVAFTSIVSVFNILNVDVTGGAGWSCNNTNSYDFVDKLVIRTLYPVVGAMVIGLVYMCHSVVVKRSEHNTSHKMEQIGVTYFTGILMASYVILPGISTTIFQTFR